MPYFLTLRPRILSDVPRSLAAFAILPRVFFNTSMMKSFSKVARAKDSEPEGTLSDDPPV
jgi:hypothetical protein